MPDQVQPDTSLYNTLLQQDPYRNNPTDQLKAMQEIQQSRAQTGLIGQQTINAQIAAQQAQFNLALGKAKAIGDMGSALLTKYQSTGQIPTEEITSTIAAAVGEGRMTPQEGHQALSTIPGDPTQNWQWVSQHTGLAMGAQANIQLQMNQTGVGNFGRGAQPYVSGPMIGAGQGVVRPTQAPIPGPQGQVDSGRVTTGGQPIFLRPSELELLNAGHGTLDKDTGAFTPAKGYEKYVTPPAGVISPPSAGPGAAGPPNIPGVNFQGGGAETTAPAPAAPGGPVPAGGPEASAASVGTIGGAGGMPINAPLLKSEGGKAFNADLETSNSYQSRALPMKQALAAVEKAPPGDFGPGSDTQDTIRSFILSHGEEALKNLGVNVDRLKNNTTAYEEAKKYFAQALIGSPFANDTNYKLDIQRMGTPNTEQFKDAIIDLARMNIATEQFRSAKALMFSAQHPDQNDLAKASQSYKTQFGPQYDTSQDPRAFYLAQLPPAERGAYLSKLPESEQRAIHKTWTEVLPYVKQFQQAPQ